MDLGTLIGLTKLGNLSLSNDGSKAKLENTLSNIHELQNEKQMAAK
jgi:hypothetical protein